MFHELSGTKMIVYLKFKLTGYPVFNLAIILIYNTLTIMNRNEQKRKGNITDYQKAFIPVFSFGMVDYKCHEIRIWKLYSFMTTLSSAQAFTV